MKGPLSMVLSRISLMEDSTVISGMLRLGYSQSYASWWNSSLPSFFSFLPSSKVYWAFPFFFFHFYWSIIDLQHCVSFKCTAKWISYTYIYIHSFRFLAHRDPSTEHWEEFPVLYSRSLLVIYFIYRSVHRAPQVAQWQRNHLPTQRRKGRGCYPVWGLACTCSCGFLSESSCWTIPAHLHTFSHFSLFFFVLESQD